MALERPQGTTMAEARLTEDLLRVSRGGADGCADIRSPGAEQYARAARRMGPVATVEAVVARLPKQLLVTSGALYGTFLLTGGLGIVFWFFAARYFTVSAVGFGAAAVSAMIFLSIFSSGGLGTLLLREVPDGGERGRALFASAVLAAGAIGLLLGLAFSVVVPLVSVSFRPLGYLQNAAAFSFGVGLTTAMLVLDQILAGRMLARMLLLRGFVFGASKLILIVIAGTLFGHHSGMLIFAIWVAGDVASVAVLAIAAARRGRVAHWLPGDWRVLLGLLPRAPGHQLLNIGLLAPGWAMPVLVTVLLSPELNASFYVAQMLALPAGFVPGVLAFSLFAVAVREPSGLPHQLRVTLGLSLASAAAATLAVLLLGRWVLDLFGPAYAQDGFTALVALTITLFPGTIKVHFANLRRIQGRTGSGSIFVVLGGVLELVCAAVGAIVGGVSGVGIGILAATTIEGLLMLPPVLNVLRMGPDRLRRAA